MVIEDDRFEQATRVLVALGPLVVVLGLLAEVSYARGGSASLADALSLSSERNLPTAFSASLLLASSIGLLSIAKLRASASSRGFYLFALLMLYAAIDEAIELHEYLGHLVDGDGVLYYSWVLPGAALVVVLALMMRRFLLSLSAQTRRAFVLSACVFLAGALFMELPLGLYASRYGDEDFGYALIDWVEETLEIVGSSLFLRSVAALRIRVLRGESP